MKRLFTLILLGAFLCFAQTLDISAQKAEIYDVVPESQRAALKIRIYEYLDANYSKQWEKVFDFISPHLKTATAEERKQGIVVIENPAYFRNKRFDKITRFTAQEVRKNGEDFYSIIGCGTFKKAGQRQGEFWAFYQNGAWYFSDITKNKRYFSEAPILCEH